MNAQTVNELKSAVPPTESLWHFLAQLPGTMEAQILYALLIGGFVGMGAHYFVKWAQGDIEGSLRRYLFVDNPRRSWFAVCALITELVTEVSLGMFTSPDGAFLGWSAVLLQGLKSGYLIDSIANKGNRPVWTEEKRAAKTADAPAAGS